MYSNRTLNQAKGDAQGRHCGGHRKSHVQNKTASESGPHLPRAASDGSNATLNVPPSFVAPTQNHTVYVDPMSSDFSFDNEWQMFGSGTEHTSEQNGFSFFDQPKAMDASTTNEDLKW